MTRVGIDLVPIYPKEKIMTMTKTNKTSVDKARSIVGDRPEGRPEGDFYPTPRGATLALLKAEKPYGMFDPARGAWWESACGDGAISKVLEEKGITVYSSDKFDRGYQSGIDFFKVLPGEGFSTRQITNPPFSDLTEWIEHSHQIGIKDSILFSKLSGIAGQKRARLLRSTGLSRVWVFANRLRIGREGRVYKNGGMIDWVWLVWDSHAPIIPGASLDWIEEITPDMETNPQLNLF